VERLRVELVRHDRVGGRAPIRAVTPAARYGLMRLTWTGALMTLWDRLVGPWTEGDRWDEEIQSSRPSPRTSSLAR
jgi:hypothetical protein